MFKKHRKISGEIGYFGLEDWWTSEFDETERKYIDDIYQPMGARPQSLTTGKVLSSSQTVLELLTSIAGFLMKTEHDRALGRRVLSKAQQLIGDEKNILSVHFFHQIQIQTNYKDRDNLPHALQSAIDACRAQIAISEQAATAFRSQLPKLPQHVGYKQLTIICADQGKYKEAVELSRAALNQGWTGDWDKRIARYEKKIVN